MTNVVLSTNFVQPEFGKPTKYVPSWGVRFDFQPAIDACFEMESGEWLPVTFEDANKANAYQTAAKKRGLFNVVRRAKVVYIQLLTMNEPVDPRLHVTNPAQPGKKRAKK